MKLADKTAVITGGNSGIGLATGREFIANGARIAIFGRDARTLEAARAALGRDVLAVQGDVRNLADIDRLFDEVGVRFGKIDVLVANAGIAKFAPVATLPEALFDEMCDIHFKGTFFTIQKALPFLREGASVIVMSACTAGRQARPGTSMYTAVKAAVRDLALGFSVELLPRRIRVNTISPGMIDTPIIMREGAPAGVTPEQMAAAITQMIPVGRRGTVGEMAKAILFLASDDSSYCFGTELLADGGLTQLVPA
jgi:NAD(P)-dependent dehydrogenase (short-subunit alcohol dehydrogenase family)